MQITLNIPDEIKDELIEALVDFGGYQETVWSKDVDENPIEIPNPVPKPEFAKTQLPMVFKSLLKKYRYKQRDKIFTEDNRLDRESIDEVLIDATI